MVAFQYRMLDADNPDQVGLVSFEIVTKEAFDREDFLWTYEDNPGYMQQNKTGTNTMAFKKDVVADREMW